MKTLAVTLALTLATTAHAEPPVVVSGDTQQTIITDSGTYLVIPNYGTGGVMAVIKTADGADREEN